MVSALARGRVALLVSLCLAWLAMPAAAQPDLARRMGTTVADTGAPGYRFAQFALASADTQRRYRVWVAIPQSPAPPAGFPVAYLLDGNAALMETDAALLERLAHAPRPPVIAYVGYDSDLRIDADARAFDDTPLRPGGPQAQRDLLGGRRTGGAQAFLELIQAQVMPRVQALARTDPQQRALWGHSYGGLFALHVLFTRPQAFDVYAAIDPALWWGDGYVLGEAAAAAPWPEPPPQLQLWLGQSEGEGQGPAAAPGPAPAGRTDADVQALRTARARVPADAAPALAGRLRVRGLPVQVHALPGLAHGQTLGASLPAFLQALAGVEPVP